MPRPIIATPKREPLTISIMRFNPPASEPDRSPCCARSA